MRWLALCARRLRAASRDDVGVYGDLDDGLAGAVVWPAGAAAEHAGQGLIPGAGGELLHALPLAGDPGAVAQGLVDGAGGGADGGLDVLPRVVAQLGEVAALGVEDLRERADVELVGVGAGGGADPEPVAAADGQVRRQAAGDGPAMPRRAVQRRQAGRSSSRNLSGSTCSPVRENHHQPGQFRCPRNDAKPRTGLTRSPRADQQAASGLRSRPRSRSTYSTSTPAHSAGPPARAASSAVIRVTLRRVKPFDSSTYGNVDARQRQLARQHQPCRTSSGDHHGLPGHGRTPAGITPPATSASHPSAAAATVPNCAAIDAAARGGRSAADVGRRPVH